MSTLMSEISRLTLAERIQLAEELWDSIAAEAGGALSLSEEQPVEPQRRAQEHERDPGVAIPWEQVRADLNRRRD